MAELKYWVNIGTAGRAMIHVEQCMNAGGDPHSLRTSNTWYGPYATRGAAIDAALATGRKVVEDINSKCIINPVNPQE